MRTNPTIGDETMTGSEKQIEWAEGIIKTIVDAANIEKTRISDKLNLRIEKQDAKGNADRANELRAQMAERVGEIDEALEYAAKITNAAKVIDMRIAADKAIIPGANWYRLAGDIALMAGTRI